MLLRDTTLALDQVWDDVLLRSAHEYRLACRTLQRERHRLDGSAHRTLKDLQAKLTSIEDELARRGLSLGQEVQPSRAVPRA